MKFRYRKFALPQKSEFFGNFILKPVVPIEIASGNNYVGYAALIDSGADFCIFDAHIGEYLDLNIRNGPKKYLAA